ncbi:MAG: ATP-binding protein [Chloroflexi bacterium]|nr:ATP-binding protein [Chloroflexota bacterium]
MSATVDVTLVTGRRAIEALRNGVPNADAVRVLGTHQPTVEARFEELLDLVTDAGQPPEVPVRGLLLSGDFGSGKSHVLEYLEHHADARGFVTSRVVISKETPLYDPARLFRAAVESASVPGRHGVAIQEIALSLRQDSHTYADFYLWANRPESELAPIFPATLLLHERLNNDPELVERIRNFWAGDSLPVAVVRQALRQIGEAAAFSLKAVPTRQLTEQRFRFFAGLIRAAGYAGWMLLIDEVELIGRYSLLQRSRSYAQLARWLGRVDGAGIPGLAAVAAITDDFALNVLEERHDRDYVGTRLRDRGTDEDLITAARAEAGMRLIATDAIKLAPPSNETLRETYERLQAVHATAYTWEPPDIEIGEVALTRRMRSHVRRWINEWDLMRLYPGAVLATEEQRFTMSYGEDPAIETDDVMPEDTLAPREPDVDAEATPNDD